MLAQLTTMRSAVTDESVPTMTWDFVLSPYVYVFLASFVVAYLFTPLMRQLALYNNIIDMPDAHRKLHKAPVAYLGGVAVFLGWVAGLAISEFLQPHRTWAGFTHLHWPLSVVVGAFVIVALGLWDDTKKAPPSLKIGVQVLAACALLYGGVGTRCMDPVFAPVRDRIDHYYGMTAAHYALFNTAVKYLSSLMTIALVVSCCNATNLMDGLDGLCGGVSSVIAAGFLFLVVHMATFGTDDTANRDGQRIVLALALLGGVMAFTPFNFNPASIFLGDTGSMFIGFSFATLMTMMAEQRSKWFMAALVMFALPVLDTALAFARRIYNKRPIFSADRHHIHHQLLNRGFTVKQTTLISYGLACGFVVLGAAITFTRTRYVVCFYMVIFGSIIVAAYKMGLVHEKEIVGKTATLSDPSNVHPGSIDNASDAVLEVRTAKAVGNQPVD